MATEIIEIGTLYQGSNVGFVKDLILIPKDEVWHVDDPISEPNVLAGYQLLPGYLVLKETAKAYRIDFAHRSCSWKESSSEIMGVSVFIETIAFSWPKNNPDLHKWLQENELREWVALWRDGNGNSYLAGNSEVGIELKSERSVTDRNSVIASLTGSLPQPAWHISESDLDSFLDEVEFSEEFSFEFNA